MKSMKIQKVSIRSVDNDFQDCNDRDLIEMLNMSVSWIVSRINRLLAQLSDVDYSRNDRTNPKPPKFEGSNFESQRKDNRHTKIAFLQFRHEPGCDGEKDREVTPDRGHSFLRHAFLLHTRRNWVVSHPMWNTCQYLRNQASEAGQNHGERLKTLITNICHKCKLQHDFEIKLFPLFRGTLTPSNWEMKRFRSHLQTQGNFPSQSTFQWRLRVRDHQSILINISDSPYPQHPKLGSKLVT
jgi:hypothetical protein